MPIGISLQARLHFTSPRLPWQWCQTCGGLARGHWSAGARPPSPWSGPAGLSLKVGSVSQSCIAVGSSSWLGGPETWWSVNHECARSFSWLTVMVVVMNDWIMMERRNRRRGSCRLLQVWLSNSNCRVHSPWNAKTRASSSGFHHRGPYGRCHRAQLANLPTSEQVRLNLGYLTYSGGSPAVGHFFDCLIDSKFDSIFDNMFDHF